MPYSRYYIQVYCNLKMYKENQLLKMILTIFNKIIIYDYIVWFKLYYKIN